MSPSSDTWTTTSVVGQVFDFNSKLVLVSSKIGKLLGNLLYSFDEMPKQCNKDQLNFLSTAIRKTS